MADDSPPVTTPPSRPRIAVILAAGKGSRMKSGRPKPLHGVAGRPMLAWILDTARQAGCTRLLVVVGHGADAVRREFDADDVEWVLQEELLGTGHAVAQAEPHVTEEATVLVINGDTPLVTAATLAGMAEAAEAGWGAIATTEMEPTNRLGRILAEGGRLQRIVEAADATPEELAVRWVNVGFYAFPAPDLFDHLRRLSPDNAQGEYYLTDVAGQAVAEGRPVDLVTLEDPAEGLGVNDRGDLAIAHRAMLDRHHERLMAEGVTILDPASTAIEPTVRVGRDTVIHPSVSLFGHTRIGEDCVLHQGCWVRDSTVGDGVEVQPYSLLDDCEVAADCHVGPFARLRPASVLLQGARVGNFVELKKTRLGEGAKANHLTYLGDAEVGPGANIGAGVVTCNYDGQNKHRTEIGEGAFVGSDSMLVAPVRVGDRATTGAGSVVTHDVPDDALAVGRARQRTIPEWTRRQRGKTAEPGDPKS
ncbi:MAG: bifunctional UDP-N-acetylglucosamine diphosphorylase/glucosamine-1-phosphate N-acetyltransferase GlmU [Acidobacteriota bacterium]